MAAAAAADDDEDSSMLKKGEAETPGTTPGEQESALVVRKQKTTMPLRKRVTRFFKRKRKRGE